MCQKGGGDVGSCACLCISAGSSTPGHPYEAKIIPLQLYSPTCQVPEPLLLCCGEPIGRCGEGMGGGWQVRHWNGKHRPGKQLRGGVGCAKPVEGASSKCVPPQRACFPPSTLPLP